MAAHQPAPPPVPLPGSANGHARTGHPDSESVTPWAAISRLSGLDNVPVAGLLRVSQEQLQDVRGSVIRQVGNITRVLPDGWHVIAWYLDIESGRLELDQRGGGTGHLRVDLPVKRAGGVSELLTHAKRRDCPFVAVVAESSSRVARHTYFGTKIEHDLGRHGVELFHADEGIRVDDKKATKILLRRMKQAVDEFTAINIMELAWDGFKVHTEEGYNIGVVPHGYIGVKEPHAAPARRARGLTRTRLDVDPINGPTIAQIFQWRVSNRMTEKEIARKLNQDLERYPAPTRVRNGEQVGLGRWVTSTIRAILANPKYTGYMVWNRSTTRAQGTTLTRTTKHKANPPHLWIWSPEPTHPALVTLDMYRQAQEIGAQLKGSRADNSPNTHPATIRSYRLRGHVRCPHCGRRMQGCQRNKRQYFECRGPRDSLGRPTRAGHPGSLYIRADALNTAVDNLIAARVFGPDRYAHLRAQHDAQPREQAAQHARAIDAATHERDTITARQQSLMAELADTPPEDRAYRASVRATWKKLEDQRLETEATLAGLIATQPDPTEHAPEILDLMPQAAINLHEVPDAIAQMLYDAIQLTIRVDDPRHVHVTITLTADTPTATASVLAELDGTAPPAATPESAVPQQSPITTKCPQFVLTTFGLRRRRICVPRWTPTTPARS